MAPRAKFRHVFFDVDSTLVKIEGIDELAGGNAEIARLTEAAMSGEMSIQDVYARRLEIIRPSRERVEELARRYLAEMTGGAEETIEALRSGGAYVQLVSAGIAQAIAPLADRLGIPHRSVHAVSLEFDDAGRYAGFDRRSLLARDGGKELVVRAILSRAKGATAFVGDGTNDLETKGVVDLFVGYGGVRARARVMENADVYVSDPSLTAVLPYLMED